MAPTIHKLKQVAAKKRKAAGTASPNEGRVAAKVPRMADAARVGIKETDAEAADASGTAVVKPPRTKILKKGGLKKADTGEADAPKAQTVESARIGEVAQPPAEESVAEAGADEGVERGQLEGESPAPAPSIILLDVSPEGQALSPGHKEKGKAPAVLTMTPAAALPPTGATTEVPLPIGEPEAAGSGAGSTSTGPAPKEGRSIDPSFQSLLANHSRWAMRVIEEASVEEMQTYLRSRGHATFFREASVAHLWALNSLVALKDIWAMNDAAVGQAHEEMLSLQIKAERATMALEDTRATLKGEIEAIRLRAEKAEYALEVAQRRAANELENAQVAEEKQKAAEEKLTAAEQEADTAKEAIRQHMVRIADLEVAVAEAQGKATEAEEKGARAIEDYKKSAAFDDEVAESAASAYDVGFQDCKKKIQELYDLEDIEELQPDDVPEDGIPPSDVH